MFDFSRVEVGIKKLKKNFLGSHPAARRSGAPYPRHPFEYIAIYLNCRWLRLKYRQF